MSVQQVHGEEIRGAERPALAAVPSPDSGVILREAEPPEYEQIGELLVEAFTTGCWITEMYKARLRGIRERAETSHVWVVADGGSGRLLGAVLTPRTELYAGESFTFNILGVGRAGRGRGIGAILVTHAIELAREAGFEEIEIHSSPQMTAAHALYYRLGFARRIERETAVVDSGQRLLDFTLGLASPGSPSGGSASSTRAHRTEKETVVPLTINRPGGTTDPTGLFQPSPPLRRGPFGLSPGAAYELAFSASDPRGWAALLACRLSGYEGLISVRALSAGQAPRIVDGAGALVSDDWRYFGRGIAEAARERGKIGALGDLYPDGLRGEVDALEKVIQQDLIVGLDQALYSQTTRARETIGRVFFARLGALDVRLSARRYLLGEQLTSADAALVGVLIGYDVGPRGHLGWGAPVLADYPDLWDYAREIYQIPGLITGEDRRALGIVTGPGGETESHWGPAAPSETIADFAAAWAEPHTRERPA